MDITESFRFVGAMEKEGLKGTGISFDKSSYYNICNAVQFKYINPTMLFDSKSFILNTTFGAVEIKMEVE